MFDNFVTKRLYGSGEADISFFDTAIDRYVKNNGVVANVREMVLEKGVGGAGAEGNGAKKGRNLKGGLRKMLAGRGAQGGRRGSAASPASAKEPPLIQSARVKRELKTIVPPEPCGADLPEREDGIENAVVVRVTTKREDSVLAPETELDDDATVSSIASASTAASKLEGGAHVYYHYPTFPEHFDSYLFGTPRPMSSTVQAEYDQQHEKVGKFRRTAQLEMAGEKENEVIKRSLAISEGGPVVSFL